MKIIIAGGGKVGEVLCTDLAAEGHDIVLIEKNGDVLDRLISMADISGVMGNAASYDVQVEAGVPNCDVFISVTATDEINVMAAIIAKKLGARETIARVRNPDYSKHMGFVRESLGISVMVNPELEAARDISKTLKFPSALGIESFLNGMVNIVETRVTEKSGLDGIAIRDFRKRFESILVCIVNRNQGVTIPNGDFVLKKGDYLYVTGPIKDLENFYKAVGSYYQKIRSALIIGGGNITYYLLQMLSHSGMELKVIEQNEKIAYQLSSAFPNVKVIIGDGSDQSVLDEQGMETYDAVVAATGIDEENVLISMYAAQKNVHKIVTKINRTQLLRIVGDVGLQTVITPKRIIADNIIRFIRALSNIQGSHLDAMYRLADNQVEALQLSISQESRATSVPLKDLNIKKNLIIAYIVRENELIFPGGKDMILPGDRIIVVTTEKNFDEVDDILDD